jgi:WD40 repeat protein
MKKIFYLLTTFVLLIYIESCTGYKPIFGSSNLEFKIADYSILGDKKLGNKIYSKLYGLSQSTKNTSEIKNIYVSINTSQNKNATTKSSSGKILGYRINLSTIITIKDSMTENEILNDTFSFSSTYKVQDQFSETIKLENQTIENLIEKTYQNLLIKLSENLL